MKIYQVYDVRDNGLIGDLKNIFFDNDYGWTVGIIGEGERPFFFDLDKVYFKVYEG